MEGVSLTKKLSITSSRGLGLFCPFLVTFYPPLLRYKLCSQQSLPDDAIKSARLPVILYL